MAESQASKPARKTSVKETISSLTIAFALAFTFRGFIIEGFVIPTGSMAPTLHGAHVRMQSPVSGYSWAVGPWDYTPDRARPLPVQGSESAPLTVLDMMSGLRVGQPEGLPPEMGSRVRIRGGDRIFVLKYLQGLFNPERFDSVVFKYPGEPRENYIKRLVGLPGEEVALVDGDVFVRPVTALANNRSDWSDRAWRVVRKGEREQRTLWMPMFDSFYAPPGLEESRRGFQAPWLGRTLSGERDRQWTIGNNSSYTYEGERTTLLEWDSVNRPICDFYTYNDIRMRVSGSGGSDWGIFGSMGEGQRYIFPVSDVRVSLNIEPQREGGIVAMNLRARSHDFRAEIHGTSVRVRMKPVEGEQWTDLASGSVPRAVQSGRVTRVEFWHADQSLSVWIDGRRIVEGTYDWTPAERIAYSTTLDPAFMTAETMPRGNPLTDGGVYRRPEVRIEFSGTPVTIHRVRLDRDLHYQPGEYAPRHTRSGEPALATHPLQPCVLGEEQYFLCGDNSASSLDGRLWDSPSPWIGANTGDSTTGIVHENLIIGRAFFVYFPAMNRQRGFPVPDTGRLRWIW